MTGAEIEMEIRLLRERIAELESRRRATPEVLPPPPVYMAYQVLAGFFLGVFGATTSLLFNVVGSLMTGRHPLELIRVYLTFPLGADAFKEGGNGLMLVIGCCLYLATGMFLGVPFHLALRRLPLGTGLVGRLAVVTVLSIALWLVNFYGILSWLQPLLFGGRWIVDLIPWWVAMLTHLVFGWTMLLVEPLGRFERYVPIRPLEVI